MKQKSDMDKNKEQETAQSQQQSKSCFVIMPISDTDGYETGHFDRVFNYIIKPACERAGFVATRADKNTKTNYIVIDILRQIINSDMAICDLSSRNSNVFFELGLRQAFNLKTVLIKDAKTPRSFDISGLRCIDYDESLRVDTVESIVEQISKSLIETMESKDEEVNSLIQLLAVDAAKLPDKVKLSNDTGIILNEIRSLRQDIAPQHMATFNSGSNVFVGKVDRPKIVLPNGEMAAPHSKLYIKEDDLPFYPEYGIFIERKDGISVIKKGNVFLNLADNDSIWQNLTIKKVAF